MPRATTNWFNPKPTCVILAGGKGERILPLSLTKQKTLIEINNVPILRYVIDYWRPFCGKFIFLVHYKKEEVIQFVKTTGIHASFIEVSALRGIADAVSYVENHIQGRFVVVLSDCVCKGEFLFPENMRQGVGVIETANEADISRSYSTEIKDNFIQKVVEKPKHLPNNLCGMGFYFFDERVFKFIKETPPSLVRDAIEITDVIQKMIDHGEKISPVFFNGHYINVTYPEDISRAERIFSHDGRSIHKEMHPKS